MYNENLIPVVVEDLIKIVINPNLSNEDKQHHVKRLEDIYRACNAALERYNTIQQEQRVQNHDVMRSR